MQILEFHRDPRGFTTATVAAGDRVVTVDDSQGSWMTSPEQGDVASKKAVRHDVLPALAAELQRRVRSQGRDEARAAA